MEFETIILQLPMSRNGNNSVEIFWILIMIRVSSKMEWSVASETFHSSKYIRKNLSTTSSVINKSCWISPRSHSDKNSFKKFPDPDRDPDDFQHLVVTSLSKDTYLIKFSWISDESFLWGLNLLTDRQTCLLVYIAYTLVQGCLVFSWHRRWQCSTCVWSNFLPERGQDEDSSCQHPSFEFPSRLQGILRRLLSVLLLSIGRGSMVKALNLHPANLHGSSSANVTHMSQWWRREGYPAKIAPLKSHCRNAGVLDVKPLQTCFYCNCWLAV